jgi:glyoxylase-like metal-dependent hydrolase (beta-lactamase superfamily II)
VDNGNARYDGNVSVGGPPQRRELPGLAITKIAVGGFDNNAYLLRAAGSGETLLIDAAAEPERLLPLVRERLDLVLTTHQHRDHWGALADVVQATGAPVAMGEPDADAVPVPVSERLHDGETITLGPLRLEVIRLSGHTPGGVALLWTGDDERPHLFTGDSLFPGGPGNTFGDHDKFVQLMDDLQSKVFGRLPDETWVYPGHGADTTLGAERPHLPEWRERGW